MPAVKHIYGACGAYHKSVVTTTCGFCDASGRREEAQTALDETLYLDADAAIIGYALVFARLRAAEFEAALRSAQDLRERFPATLPAAHLVGGIQGAMEQYAAAWASFEAVIAIDPAFHQTPAT